MELTAVPATQFSSVQLTDILNACFEAYLVPVTQSVEGFVQRFSAEGMSLVDSRVWLAALPRAETARVALSASRIIVARDLAQCVAISNLYGPEHLIIQTRQARELVDSITSAGSVFLGDWSPESAGDYASGTNHVLPTYGYTATCSSLGLADFQKRMTVQELSRDGFAALASTIEILAAAERLDAHKNAVTLRVAALKEQA